MKVFHTRSFRKDYKKLPKHIQELTNKKMKLFVDNTRHPSLRVHKIKKTSDILEGSVTKNYRFTFRVEDGTCIMRRVGGHDIIESP